MLKRSFKCQCTLLDCHRLQRWNVMYFTYFMDGLKPKFLVVSLAHSLVAVVEYRLVDIKHDAEWRKRKLQAHLHHYFAWLFDAFWLVMRDDHFSCLFAQLKREFCLASAFVGIGKNRQCLRVAIEGHGSFER